MRNDHPLSPSHSLVGTVLLGRYRIVRELAKGGMGVVYLARSEGAVGFVKPVVVKLVLPEHASDERFLGMFAREAQILANLRHPSIVDVIEFGEQDGAYIMVLEYVRGYHLGQWAKYLRLRGRTIPAPIGVQVIIDVLEALHHAHSMSHPDGTSMHIVHRDVSPSNILLDEDGRARLLDFGVARMRGGTDDYQTQVKGFVGKLMYSAPEIFAEGEATPKSDCYACAVVLHEILAGRNTFRSESQARTLNRVLNHLPELLEGSREDIQPGLDAVLQRAAAKSPQQRFDTAHDFAQALRELQPQAENELRAQLAAMLKEDFGRDMAEALGLESLADRDDAWRSLNAPSSRRVPDPQLPSGFPTGPSSVSSRSGGGLRSQLSASTGGLSGGAPPTVRRTLPPPPPPTPSSRATSPPQGERTMMLTALGVAFTAALIALYLAVRTPGDPSAAAPRIRVVATPELPDRPQNPLQASVDDTPPAKLDRAAAPPKRPPARGPNPRQLTQAFRRQKGKIESCFQEHAAGIEGVPVIQLEFSLDASGHLEEVAMKPADIGATPLGACIQKVAETTHFPPQGRAVSFSIPLSASRASNGS